MGRIPFPAFMLALASYGYAATVVSAAWFLRRDRGLALMESIVWAGLLFSPWILVGSLVWAVLRREHTRERAMAVLFALTLPVVPLAALATTLIDRGMRQADWSVSDTLTRTVDRLPVAILLYTAMIAGGLAAAYWRRADAHRQEAEALKAALHLARSAPDSSDTPTTLMVSMGRRRVPVSPQEVEWVSSAGNYTVVHWRDREGLLREPLQQLEARLKAARFARGHRSTLINLARVADLRPLADGAWQATMDSGAQLVISRTYRDAFLGRLGRRQM